MIRPSSARGVSPSSSALHPRAFEATVAREVKVLRRNMVDRPASLLQPLAVPHKLLMGPGPSNCSPRVLQAMGLPVLGHLHEECVKIMDDIKEGLQYVFQTKNTLTLAISASGHGGMEAALCNLIEPGDTVLVGVHGIWGERASDMARRYGAVVHGLKKPAGQNFSLEEVEEALIKYHPDLFFVTQGESSTGVYQPLEGFGALCHKYNCLFVVDTVASLGGVPVYTDRWEIDVIYTGSQKVLGAPPGLAPISFSPKAQAKVTSRKTPIKVFYWDMNILGDYWACFGRPRVYHHTISANLLYGLREGLAQIVEEGIDQCVKRHKTCAELLHKGLREMGLELFVNNPDARLPTVTTIKIPAGVDGKLVSQYTMKNYHVEISGGLGPTLGKVMRVGIMGHNATPTNVSIILRLLKEALQSTSTFSSKL